jgi:hypothetical protein
MDSYGSLIDGVRISAKRSDGLTFFTKSSTDGRYTLSLPVGVFDLEFARNPYRSFLLQDYQVPNTRRMRLDISLIRENCTPVELSVTKRHIGR